MGSYQYDNANRLTSVDGVNYTFDANGNLLNDGVNSYAYDSANRLISVNGTESYTYNGLGDRLMQNGVQYTLDLNPSTGSGQVAGLTQVLDDGTNTYTYGLGCIAQLIPIHYSPIASSANTGSRSQSVFFPNGIIFLPTERR